MELLHLVSFVDRSKRAAKNPLPAEMHADPIQGGQILLFRGRRSFRKLQPRAGLYMAENPGGRILWAGEAAGPRDIRGENRFILVDGPSLGRTESSPNSDPLERMGRLVFSEPILTPEGLLRPGILDVVEQMQGLMLEQEKGQ